MDKKLTVSKAKELASAKRLWLLNLDNGRVLCWSPILATNKRYVDCLQDGTPVSASDVPGNHPWIRQTTLGVKMRLKSEKADDDSIREFGRILTERGNEKFRALSYQGAEKTYIEANGNPVGPTIRINKNIDKRVAAAKKDLLQFSLRIRQKLGLIN